MSARQIKVEFVKTYATEENAVKAAESRFANSEIFLRYIVIPVESDKGLRYGVAFLGQESLQAGVHFSGFNVLG